MSTALTAQQIANLQAIWAAGAAAKAAGQDFNYADGYKYLSDIIGCGDGADGGLKNWLDRAQSINANDGSITSKRRVGMHHLPTRAIK